MYSIHVSTILLRRINLPNNVSKDVRLIGYYRFHGRLGGYGRRLSAWFGERAQIVRACTKQFEFVAAQRIRRGIQLFHLYTKIWDDTALKEFMRSWRRRVGRNARDFVVGAVGLTMYNWDGERISEQELHRYSKEIEGIYKLRDATLVCDKCQLRLLIDTKQPEVKYCCCHGNKPALASAQKEIDWQPFIERQDMLIWRKEEPETGGLYAYKVFGSFSDVTAEDFLQVQVDVDYRKEWDSTARRLEIIDSDPQLMNEKNRQRDVIYWEMTWPRLFSNRDYVYERTWVLDRDKGIVVIVSEATNHPDAPIRPDTHRVTTYWSYMVIKPHTDFNEPGIEFSLTYFDDPGVNIPSTFTSWVAASGLPDFLCSMRQAAKEYKKYIEVKSETSKESLKYEEKLEIECSPEIILVAEESSKVERRMDSGTKNNDFVDKSMDGNDVSEDQDEEKVEEAKDRESTSKNGVTETKPEEEHGYLRYFFLTKLFA